MVGVIVTDHRNAGCQGKIGKSLAGTPGNELLVEDLVAMPGQALKAALHLGNATACLHITAVVCVM